MKKTMNELVNYCVYTSSKFSPWRIISRVNALLASKQVAKHLRKCACSPSMKLATDPKNPQSTLGQRKKCSWSRLAWFLAADSFELFLQHDLHSIVDRLCKLTCWDIFFGTRFVWQCRQKALPGCGSPVVLRWCKTPPVAASFWRFLFGVFVMKKYNDADFVSGVTFLMALFSNPSVLLSNPRNLFWCFFKICIKIAS